MSKDLYFKQNKYVVIREAISKDICDFGVRYMSMMRDKGNMDLYDKDVWNQSNSILKPNHSNSMYGSTFGDTLLDKLLPDMEFYTELKLLPTYSFLRIYKRNALLGKHTDRPACEISTSICLGTDGETWPLYLLDINGNEKSIELNQGDMLIYRGMELHHWRNENTYCDNLYQGFLHYVDANGKYTREELDGRESLGTKYIEDKFI